MKLASTRAACDRIELIQLPFTDPPVMERRRFVSMIVLISGQRPLRSERPFSAADERKARRRHRRSLWRRNRFGFPAGAPVSRHDFLPRLTIRFWMLMHIDLRSS
jgi:hypothetical protein